MTVKTSSPSSHQFTAPLQFVSLMDENREFIALIDSGAQLNVMSEGLLASLSSYTDLPSSITRLRGVDDSLVQITCWIATKFMLSNGETMEIPFAIVRNIKAAIILGLPFLKQLDGKIDHRHKVIDTTNGPIILLDGFKAEAHTTMQTMSCELKEDKVQNAQISDVGKERLAQILETYKLLYEGDRRGEVKGLTHAIVLTTKRPITSRARVHSEEHDKAIAEEVDRMLKDRVIVPSESPYSSEIVMVRKKTGEWRMCIDYRPLNKHTVDDKYPLPRISDLLFSAKSSRYFVALDLRSGYWQIPMDPACRQFTAFRCTAGLYEFLVMPFGLKNAPATFQRNMDFLLRDLRFKNVLVYIDDILVHHENEEGCLDLLEIVFERLKLAGMTINLQKSTFFPRELRYLGHLIEQGRLRPDPKKVAVLDKIQGPKTITEVRSLLGMIGYFQNYIPGYSRIAVPITNLLKNQKNRKRLNKQLAVEWSQECQQAILTLLSHLKHAVLTIPIDGDVFEVETDASDHAIGGVLTVVREQGPLPVSFVSKKLSSTEKRWATREKKAFAIIYCLRKFDRFVRPFHFTVITDNQSLQWLFDAKVGKLARWAVLMSEYNMSIRWRKGQSNAVADYLSRYIDAPDPVEDRMVYAIDVDDDFVTVTDVLKAQLTCLAPTGRGYLQRGKTILYRNGIWVPEALRMKVVAACHLLPSVNHPGIKRTKNIILRVFNWPDLHGDVTEYVKSCLVCQRQRGNALTTAGRHLHDPLEGAFSILHIDFWSCGYGGETHHVLTMIDPFTRWAEAEELEERSAKAVASAILRNWICRFGVPRRLVSDHEAIFINNVIREFTATMGISHVVTVPYRPQGNAPVEAFHKTLNKFFTFNFRKVLMPEALSLALYSYRSLIHSSSLESPAFLVYGRDLVPPQDCDWRFYSEASTQERIRFINQLRKDILTRSQQLSRIARDKALSVDLRVNDLVIVKARPPDLLQHGLRGEFSTKLIPKWSLPARVEGLAENRQRIHIRFLVTGRTRTVHISEVKVIGTPKDINQRNQWIQQHEAELHKPISLDWDEVIQPQKKFSTLR